MQRYHLIVFLVACLAGSTLGLPTIATAQSRSDSSGIGPAEPQTVRPEQAAPPTPTGERPFAVELMGRLTVRADRTATETATRRTKILSASVIQTLSQQQVQFVDGMQKVETLEAFTEK